MKKSHKYGVKFSIIVLFCSVINSHFVFADHHSVFHSTALIDVRVAHTDEQKSWLKGGFGKTRFGNGEPQTIGRLAEVALLSSYAFDAGFKGDLYLKHDSEQKNEVDVVEGFISFRSNLNENIRYKIRAGIFFPPFSLENRSQGWLPTASITPSAINGWIGDELKTMGGEMSLSYEAENSRLGIIGALFAHNDPVGSLLVWRGWTFGDRKTGWNDQVVLPEIPSIQATGSFKNQAHWVEPFTEIDDKIGFYSGLSWSNLDNISTHLYYYDNRADQLKFDGFQYAWATHFISADLKILFHGGIELLTQYMSGNTQMGGKAVDVDFESYYLLLNKEFEQITVTMRYDYFSLKDKDLLVADDDNNENGNAWTVAMKYDLAKNHSFLLEAMTISSDRNAQAYFLKPKHTSEVRLQGSLRLFF
ncbi:MAG: hypothetical protein HON94_07155 [Methylococcales bacterium]|nr:hypothetical protein [Methylococcales bacterium]MBT7408116.1 hypothetical protein [Methylococcales bacterium]